MDALLIKPGRYPERIQIDNELKKLQEVVEGNIEVTYPWADEVGIICNEEGKFNGQTLNRALFDQDGRMYDIIAGPFLVVGLTEDDFGSLSPEQMEKYDEMFHQPEMFVKMGRGIVPIRLEDDQVKEMTEKAGKDIAKTVATKNQETL